MKVSAAEQRIAGAPSTPPPGEAKSAGRPEASQIPRKLHWIWVGDTQPSPKSMLNIMEVAHHAPGFAKTIWTNDPNLVYGALRNLHAGHDIDESQACVSLRALEVRVEHLDALTRTPAIGLSRRDLTMLDGHIAREWAAPLGNKPSASDILRILALHRHGGVYMDADFRPFGASKTDDNAFVETALHPRIPRWQTMPFRGDILEGLDNEHGFAFLCQDRMPDYLNNSVLAARPAQDRHAPTARVLRRMLELYGTDVHPESAHAHLRSARIPACPGELPGLEGEIVRMQAELRACDAPTVSAEYLREVLYVYAAQRMFQRFDHADHALRAQAIRGRVAICTSALYLRPEVRVLLMCERAPSNDEKLPVSFGVKRLCPAQKETIVRMRSRPTELEAPNMLMTHAMTGPTLLFGELIAPVSHTREREAMETGASAARRGEIIARTRREFKPASAFFSRMPPCNHPSLRALDEIAYARDA